MLVFSQGLLSVKAETLTKDFGQTNFNSSDYSGYNIFATIDVIATIQTEPNGYWIQNNIYQVNWLITITYLNQSVYNSDDFSIEFYNPDNPVYNAIENVTAYDTTVTPKNSGTLSMTLRPQSVGDSEFNSAFALKVYDKGNIVTSGSWEQSFNNQPIHISVKSNQHLPFDTPSPTPIAPELTPLAIVVALAVVTSSIALYSRKVKSGKLNP